MLSVFRKNLLESETRLALNPRAAALAAGLFGYRADSGRVQVPLNLAATSISNAADLVPAQQGFRAALLENVVGQIDPLIALAFEVKSNRATEHHIALGDLPQMEEWTNDRVMSSLGVEASIAITNKKWQATLRVKNDDLRDDALGLLPAHIAGMGQQAALQPGNLVARMLCNGFDGADASLGDGLAFDGDFFFSASHATGSNLLTGAGSALSATALGQAFTLLRQQQRFDGLNLYAKPTHLIVGVDLEETAIKILSSDFLATQFNGGTAAAPESNTYKRRVELIVSPIIPAGHWFVADLSNPVKPMLFQNREGIMTNVVGGGAQNGPGSGNDFVGFSYDETWFGAFARNNAGYWDFRRIIGATGS